MNPQAGPFVVVAKEDMADAGVLDCPLPVVLFSEDGGAPGFFLDDETLTFDQLYLGLVGVLVLSEHGIRAEEAVQDIWRDRFGDVAPAGLDLRGSDPVQGTDHVRQRLLTWLVGALAGSRTLMAQRNAKLMRDLATLRQAHEATQASFQRLERFFHEVVRVPRWLAFVHEAVVGAQAYVLEDGEWLEQRIPIESVGLSDIAIGIGNKGLVSGGTMTASLAMLESGDIVGVWVIPSESLGNGWTRLSLPTAFGSDAQTTLLRIEWRGNGGLRLNSSIKHPDERFCADLNGVRQARVLALRGWKYVAGCEAATPSEAHLPTAVAVSQLVVSPQRLADATNPRPSDFTIDFVEEKNALMVHVLPKGVCMARLDAACPAGTREVVAKIETLSEEGPEIEYALAVTDASNRKPSLEDPSFPEAWLSEWVRIGPKYQSEVRLEFSPPLEKSADLYLMTRLPSGRTDDAFGWSTFRDVTITLRPVEGKQA